MSEDVAGLYDVIATSSGKGDIGENLKARKRRNIDAVIRSIHQHRRGAELLSIIEAKELTATEKQNRINTETSINQVEHLVNNKEFYSPEKWSTTIGVEVRPKAVYNFVSRSMIEPVFNTISGTYGMETPEGRDLFVRRAIPLIGAFGRNHFATSSMDWSSKTNEAISGLEGLVGQAKDAKAMEIARNLGGAIRDDYLTLANSLDIMQKQFDPSTPEYAVFAEKRKQTLIEWKHDMQRRVNFISGNIPKITKYDLLTGDPVVSEGEGVIEGLWAFAVTAPLSTKRSFAEMVFSKDGDLFRHLSVHEIPSYKEVALDRASDYSYGETKRTKGVRDFLLEGRTQFKSNETARKYNRFGG